MLEDSLTAVAQADAAVELPVDIEDTVDDRVGPLRRLDCLPFRFTAAFVLAIGDQYNGFSPDLFSQHIVRSEINGVVEYGPASASSSRHRPRSDAGKSSVELHAAES